MTSETRNHLLTVLSTPELAEVDQGGGERQQRLSVAGIACDLGRAARSLAQGLQRFADLPLVPAAHRASDEGRGNGLPVMLAPGGEDGVGGDPGQLVMRFCQRPQLRGGGLIAKFGGQPWVGERKRHPGFGGSLPGLAS